MSNNSPTTIIKTTALDNVGIVSNPSGLPKGTIVSGGIVLTEDIPMGHKAALVDMPAGSSVIRHREIIRHTIRDITKGSWINETNIEMPQAPELKDIPYINTAAPSPEPLNGFTFQGYRNADGTVGTKNILAITESVQC